MGKFTMTTVLKGLSLLAGLASLVLTSMIDARVQQETKDELRNELLNELNGETEED